MSVLFKPTTLVGAIAIAMGSTSSVFADTLNSSMPQLDPIVITASKTEENLSQVPTKINIITEKTIQQSPNASLVELLQQDAALNIVQSGGIGQITSVFTRGTESDQTLVLKDGMRLNTASSGMASLNFLDTSDLERIEILKGPSSVLYGSDAIGGVIQLISKTPLKNSAFVTGEYGENNTYKALVGADLAENGYYAQVRGQRLESDGTPVNDSLDAPNASFDQKGFSGKFGIDQQNYAIGAEYSENQGTSQYDNGAPVSQDFKNQLINVTGRYNITDALALNARWSQFKDELDQNDVNYLAQYDYVNSERQETDLNVKWDFLPFQNILVGATITSLDVDSLSFGTPYKKSLDSNGYYIQHQYHNNGIDTQVGVRVEDNDQFGTHTVGQGAIRYQLLPTTSIYANIGSAFRAPSGNDLYGYGGNPDLNPEESLSYEIGLDQKLNYGITTGISLYSTKVDNLINSICISACDGWSAIYQNYNVDKAKMQGGEAYAKWQNENLYINLGYSYVRAKDESTNDDLSRRPRQKASLTTGWADERYAISTTLIGVSSSDNSAFDTTTIPGHMQMDLHTHLNINPYIKLFANVQNMWDSKYSTAYSSGSYYINGGRYASVGVTLRY